MAFTEITTHVQDAIDRLIQQYKNSPRIQGILKALVEQIQELETVQTQLNEERAIDTAIGVQLDNLGKIIGLTRIGGEPDEAYRIRLQARIGLNVSQGEPERLISTFKLLVGADFVLLQELPPADVAISSSTDFASQDEVDAALAIIEAVSPAAVRVSYIGVFDETEPFAMNGSLSGLGFSSLANPTTGGKFSSIVQRNNFFSFDGAVDTQNEGFGTIEDTLVGGQLDTL